MSRLDLPGYVLRAAFVPLRLDPGPMGGARPSIGFDLEGRGGDGRSGSSFMRSGFGFGDRINRCDMAVPGRNCLAVGGVVRLATLVDWEMAGGVGERTGGHASMSDWKDTTNLACLSDVGVGTGLLGKASLSVRNSVGEQVEEMAESDRKDT